MSKRPKKTSGRKKTPRTAKAPSSKTPPEPAPERRAAGASERPEPVTERDRRHSWARVGFSLAALTALAYRRVLFLGETFVERDALRFTLPSREFLVRTWRDGRIPEWFDGVNFGAPFAANPVHEVFAPLGWTMALVPTALGFDLYVLLHVLIGGLGTAALSRRLGAGAATSGVAGASLALGGYVTSMVPNGLAPDLAWTPWVAWAAHRFAARLSDEPSAEKRAACRRAGGTFAATFALQLFAGEPASVLIAALVAGLVVALSARRPLFALGATLVSALGSTALAALAILPGLYLLAGSARGAGIDMRGLEWSLHPARLLELVWPMPFGSPVGDGWYAGLLLRDGPGDPFWSLSLFVGFPVLLSAAAAWREPRVRRWLLASLPFVLLAAAPLTPAYPLLQRLLPPLQLVNFPEKFVYGALLFLTAAAGVGLTRLLERGAPRRMRIAALASAAVLVLGLAALAASRSAIADVLGQRAADWGVLIRPDAGVAAAIRGGIVAAAGLGLFALALELRRRSSRWAPALTFLSVLGPLVWAAGTTTPFAPRWIVSDTPALLRAVEPSTASSGAPRPRLFRLEPLREDGPFRSGADVARSYHESFTTNVASRFGIAVLPGFEPGQSARFRRFGREIMLGMNNLSLVRLLGIEWVAVHDSVEPRPLFEEVSRGAGGWALLSPGRVRPRAFVAPRWMKAEGADPALDGLTIDGREKDPAMVVIVRPDPEKRATTAPLSPCGVRMPRPEEVLLDCDSPAGGYAVLLDEWAPGWSATVDGRDADVLLAEGLFRAVAVDAGRHQIVLRYRTPGLRAGAAVSLAAWLVWGALMIGSRRRARPAPPRIAEVR